MPSAEEVKQLVKTHEDATLTRLERMDADFHMWQLLELPENLSIKEEAPGIGAGYKHYTSNEPKTFAKQGITIASGAKIIPRVKGTPLLTEDERLLLNHKERFIIGALAAADERLRRMMESTLQDQSSWYASIRGWIAVRALLRKKPNGETFVDISPLDPRNTFWGLGPNGLDDAWVVSRTYKTPLEIKTLYGVDVSGSNITDQGVPIYDYVDATNHMVCTEDKVLVAMHKHGSPRTPVSIVPGGETPSISDPNGTHSSAVGESIYEADRRIYPYHNFTMSVVLELMSRARTPGTKVFSADGQKTLDEDPHQTGTQVGLRTGFEDVRPMEQIETTKDATIFAGAVSGELQRGAIPHSVYGELEFQLSGFAINSLRQGVSTIITPIVKALIAMYKDICNLLVDQYVTGIFKPMELAGIDQNREYFDEEITPDMMKQAKGRIEVTILPELPQDEPAKMQMAMMARQPGSDGKPFMADRDIREDIMNYQDPDAIAAAVNEQLMESATPMAQALSWIRTAERMGRADLVQVYTSELERVMRDILAQSGQNGAAPNAPGAPNGTLPGVPADIAPSQATGVPQVAPTPQQGPNVPPRSPRPGRPVPEEQQALN